MIIIIIITIAIIIIIIILTIIIIFIVIIVINLLDGSNYWQIKINTNRIIRSAFGFAVYGCIFRDNNGICRWFLCFFRYSKHVF